MNKTSQSIFLKLVGAFAALLMIGCAENHKHYIVNDCQIERVDGGQVITCGMDQLVVPDQEELLQIIDPCGDGPGVDEVVLVFEGSLYIAWYKNVGMTLLEPYTRYKTTDKQKCEFRLTPSGLEEL